MSIIAKTNRVWELQDATNGKRKGGKLPTYQLPIGTHKLERVRCPIGYDCDWLVLAGTKIGMSEGYWKGWIKWVGDQTFNIELTENGNAMTART